MINYQGMQQDFKPKQHEIIHAEEVIIGTEQGTTFPTKIGTSMCNALIDTGATKSCISEKYYQQLPAMKMQKLSNINVRSATGSNLVPLGIIQCSFKLGTIRFHGNFVVCRNLTRPLILGRDFLLQHHITVHYVTNGKCVLDYQQHQLVASINIEDKPQIHMAHSVTIQGRTLAIIYVHSNLDSQQSGSLYDIEPNDAILEKHPNMCIVPMIHNVDVHRTEHLPLIIINFASDDISLLKEEIMGFMLKQPLEISDIMMETSTEPSIIAYEEDINEVLKKQKGEVEQKNKEKKFITSPADIEVHRKVELQDADIIDEQ